MLILGVEFTAHTFGVGIVDHTGKIFANSKDSYSTQQEGLIPNQVAAHHEQVAEKVLAQAFQEATPAAKANGQRFDGWPDIDFIAYSAGPGLDPCLLTGYKIVKNWSQQFHKKLIGVNHCAAHLSIGKLWNNLKDPCYLYVSGVNTQIIIEDSVGGGDKDGDRGDEDSRGSDKAGLGRVGKYRVLGETLDIGLGNLLDKFARSLGLGFPGGPKIEELAKKGSYVELPYVVKGMDVSFSGILTKVERLWERKLTWGELLKKQGKDISLPYIGEAIGAEGAKIISRIHREGLNKKITKEDLCFSLQETCFAMCTEVAERAMAHTGKNELLLVGGVGANKRFCQMLEIMCNERGAKFYNVPLALATDNGAMVAWEGFLRRGEVHGEKKEAGESGRKKERGGGGDGDINVKPHWRVEEV